jgi:tetratricopeptide (TPR) repeat protein
MTLGVSLAPAAPASPEREKALTRALELCEQLGDSRMMEVMLSLGFLRSSRAEPLVALQLFAKALALAEQAKNADAIAAAYAGIGLQRMTLGQFEEARPHFERAIESSYGRPIGKFGHSARVTQSVPSLLPVVLLVLGYPTSALKRSKIALDAARRRSEPFVNAVALGTYVLVYLTLGDLRAVAEQVDELVALTAEHEITIAYAFATFYRACLAAEAGQVDECIAEIRSTLTQLGVYWLASMLVAPLAEVCCRNGLPNEGLAVINEALERSERIPWCRAELHRLKGELTLLKDPGRELEAESYFREAIDIAQRQSARLFELRSTMSLARLLRKQGHRDEAHTILAEIYNWFTEGFDTADLKEAKALLDELSA